MNGSERTTTRIPGQERSASGPGGGARPDQLPAARRALAAGDPTTALEVLRAAIRDGEDGGLAWLGLATAAMRAGRLDEAEDAIRQALRRKPGNAATWLEAGRIHAAGQRWKDAEDAFRRAELLRPDSAEPSTGVVETCHARGVYDSVPAALSRACVLTPRQWSGFPSLSRMPLLPGSLRRALEASDFGPSLRRIGNRWLDPFAFNFVVGELARRGHAFEAVAMIRSVLTREPGHIPALQQLHLVLKGEGAHEASCRYLLQAVILSEFEQNVETLYHQIKRSAHDFSRFVQYFREHAGKSPRNRRLRVSAEKAVLNADPRALVSSAALRAAARRQLPVADARVLREAPLSRFGTGDVVQLDEAVVSYDMHRLLLIKGDVSVVADDSPIRPGNRYGYVRFADERMQTLGEAFLVGRSHNHYDFLIETSQNLKRYVDGGFDCPFLSFGPHPTRAQADLFDILGVAARARPWITLDCRINCDRLAVTRAVFRPNGWDPDHLHWLRARVMDRASDRVPATAPRRLFLTRRDSDRRRVANENEIAAVLEARGFVSVTLEGRGLLDQAALFAGADIVVAGKGAGMANIVFCRPGTRIVELSPARPQDPHHFRHISEIMGLDYRVVYGQAPAGAAPWSNANEQPRHVDVTRILREI